MPSKAEFYRQMAEQVSTRLKILVLNAKEVLNLFRIIFLPKARCSSARI